MSKGGLHADLYANLGEPRPPSDLPAPAAASKRLYRTWSVAHRGTAAGHIPPRYLQRTRRPRLSARLGPSTGWPRGLFYLSSAGGPDILAGQKPWWTTRLGPPLSAAMVPQSGRRCFTGFLFSFFFFFLLIRYLRRHESRSSRKPNSSPRI
jgi:hypothetical protein